MIHPTAIIDADASLGERIEVGAYCVIDRGTILGDGCWLGPHVHITGQTRIGAGNRFHAGAVIGDEPQDLGYGAEPTGLHIGERNVFRENVTVHRSSTLEKPTVIGDGNLFMAGSHVGHDCTVGSEVIVANGSMLGGHVTIEDSAFLSGNCLVHQFVKIGRLALLHGGAAVSKDVPPFCIAAGDNRIYGLNTVGLRRGGISATVRAELRRLYRALFLRKDSLQVTLDGLKERFCSEPSRQLIEFVQTSKRSVCVHAVWRKRLAAV